MDIQITDRANRSDHRPVHTRLRGIISCSVVLFRIASSIIALLGVMVLATYSPKNGLILLTIAFLVSPMGLPMFAVWILSALQGISHFIKSI